MKYLFDTSVWVNFWNKNFDSNTSLLENNLFDKGVVYMCPPIYQELLQGTKSKESFIRYATLFNGLERLNCEHYDSSYEAAKIYFDLRKMGITIRKPNDCLIAWYAIKNDLALVHNDKDFQNIKIGFPMLKTIISKT